MDCLPSFCACNIVLIEILLLSKVSNLRMHYDDDNVLSRERERENKLDYISFNTEISL